MGGKRDMLNKISVIKKRGKLCSVRISQIIHVNIEVACDDKFVRCSGNRRNEGLKVFEELRKGSDIPMCSM
jgi:hypothetical protein